MTSTKPLILRLDEIEPGMARLVGGKAANLGVLLRAGFRVPAGWCLTTTAYSAAVGDRLHAVVAELAAASNDGTALDALAARARELVMGAPIPDDVVDALRRSTSGPVAVRSSATAEDLPYASFAGQQDTFLNVVGGEAVLDAVRRCWASLWNDRAVAYRAANDIDHRAVQLAVVVQDMVRAEVAGVMFTANPVTGRRHEVVIDASPGLGEAVVSGAVNPDHFQVEPSNGRIVSRRLGDKLLAVRPAPGGGVRHVSGAHPGACLTDAQVRVLAGLGAQVEKLYGNPQDIEWALDQNARFWLTQARPITTLFPVPEGRGGTRAFFSFNVAQGVYRPLTPMGVASIRAVSTSGARLWGIEVRDPVDGAPAVSAAAGRIFLDVTRPLRDRLGRAVLTHALDVMEARSAAALRSLTDDPRFVLVPSPWRTRLRPLARVLVANRLPLRLLHAAVDPAGAHRTAEMVGARLRDRLHPSPEATIAERLEHVIELLSREFAPLAMELLPRAGAGFAVLGLAARLLGDDLGPGELTTTLRSLPHNVTTEMDLALWRLAQDIGKDPVNAALVRGTPAEELVDRFRAGTLAANVAGGLRRFLAVYGDRAVAEIDLGLPRWSEDPTYLFRILASYLALTDRSSTPDVVFEQGRREAEEMVERLARRAGGLRGRLVRTALGRARDLMGMRELPKFYLVTLLAAARYELKAIGSELAQRGLLDSPEDVFFLDLHEVRASLNGAQLSARVRSRRSEYEWELRRRHVPRVLLSDGTEPEATADTTSRADGSLVGVPASAGAVTGTAAVVLDPQEARLEPGQILVCPSTDPGWTPLFLTAGGLVMEMGGANSHGAVVAREYGIPAVVGVAGATERIVTGDEITVNGMSGTVSIR